MLPHLTQHLLILTIVFLWLSGYIKSVAAQTASAHVVEQARLNYTASSTVPSENESGWQQRSLPDHTLESQTSTTGWYEVTLTLESSPTDIWAVYLPEIAVNAKILLNDQLLGYGSRYGNPHPPQTTRPLYLQIPIGMLRTGLNTLYIEINPIQPSSVFISRVHIGPATLLKKRFEDRTLWRTTVPTVVQVITAVISICLIALWVRRRQKQHYLWLVVATLFWAMHTVDLINSAAWQTHWAIWIGLLGFSVCLMMFTHRYCGLRRPLLERTLFLTAALLSLMMITSPSAWSQQISPWLFHLLLVVIAIYSSWIVWEHYRHSRVLIEILMVVAITITTLLALYEWLIITGVLDAERYHLLYLGIPLLQLAIGGSLSYRYLHTLRDTQSLNEDITRQVKLRTLELGEQHERLRTLERTQVLATERERMIREMHDGVGGQLVSALAMLESGQYTSQSLAEYLRGTLNDLRLILDSLDPSHSDLCIALASLRPCIETCLKSQDIKLLWQLGNLPSDILLGPQQILQVLRIVQEAVTNIVKHAQAQRVTISGYLNTTDQGSEVIMIDIVDNGVGITPTSSSGRGMKTMAGRAKDLGGSLDISSTAQGTNIRLQIPLSTKEIKKQH